jgi:hypothetical protein
VDAALQKLQDLNTLASVEGTTKELATFDEAFIASFNVVLLSDCSVSEMVGPLPASICYANRQFTSAPYQ